MDFTKKELIKFMDEPVELASEENKIKAIMVKEKFISDFEKSYGFEKEAETKVSYQPPHYVAAMPDSMQEEIREKVISDLTEHGECTPENIDRAMNTQIYDLEDLIDIREYVRRLEKERKKKAGEAQRKETCKGNFYRTCIFRQHCGKKWSIL